MKGPCAGVSGACVELTVTSPAGATVDRLVIAVAGRRLLSQAVATPLPVSLAVIFGRASGPYRLQVEGSLAGRLVGAGEAQVEVGGGQHLQVEVALLPAGPGGSDGGAPDAGPGDGPAPLSYRKVAQAGRALLAVAASGDAQAVTAYAVGEGATVLSATGVLASATWRSDRVTGTTATLRAVTLAGTQPLAAGDDGVLLRRAAGVMGAWSLEPDVPAGPTLRALWASAADDVYAVGDAGRILHRRAVWEVEPAGVQADLHGISGCGPDEVYAVGAGGLILQKRAGGAWRREAAGLTSETLRAVACAGRGDIYAVGAAGTVLHRQGGVWGREAAGLSAVTLRAVCAAGPGAPVFAAGEGGALLRRQERWSGEVGAPAADLAGAACVTDRNLAPLLLLAGGGEVLLGG